MNITRLQAHRQVLVLILLHQVPTADTNLTALQMGQTERDRRRVERLELERQHLEQLQLAEAELLNPPDPAEALNHLKPDVTWGEMNVLLSDLL